MTFKERVAAVAVSQAKRYQAVFMDYEYLVCSPAFCANDYYILAAKDDNYQHLVGVNTPRLSPKEFFSKCVQGTLTEDDFDFRKKGRAEKEVKGSVRKKIKALPYYTSMLERELVVQENFSKNKIICSFATTDHNMTIGYINNNKAHPKSLMLGDTIDWNKAALADVILRRCVGEPLFSSFVVGNVEQLLAYQSKLERLVSPGLFQQPSLID